MLITTGTCASLAGVLSALALSGAVLAAGGMSSRAGASRVCVDEGASQKRLAPVARWAMTAPIGGMHPEARTIASNGILVSGLDLAGLSGRVGACGPAS